MLQEMWIDDPCVAERVLDALQSAQGVALIELPTVFALFALPTQRGAAALDQAKQRLPGKNYGSVVGDIQRFAGLAVSGSLPTAVADPADWRFLEGNFIRLQIGPATLETPAVRGGTHQSLLLPAGPHRRLFSAIEAEHLGRRHELFGDLQVDAPLCTSANLSGHPEGSITRLDKARDFAQLLGLDLLVRQPAHDGERGSFTIVSLQGAKARIERRGPGVDALEQALAQRGLLP